MPRRLVALLLARALYTLTSRAHFLVIILHGRSVCSTALALLINIIQLEVFGHCIWWWYGHVYTRRQHPFQHLHLLGCHTRFARPTDAVWELHVELNIKIAKVVMTV